MCKLYSINYKESFLDILYKNLILNHDTKSLENLIILLPDGNSVIKLKEIFRDKFKANIIMPKIIALSDNRNLAKIFKLNLPKISNFEHNQKVRDNFLTFILSLKYLSKYEKQILLEDLLLVSKELFLANKSFKNINLNQFNKTGNEKLIAKIIDDLNNYINISQIKDSDWVFEYQKHKILLEIKAKILQNKINGKIILAGSNLTLPITQNIAKALTEIDNSAIYLQDFSEYNLNNDFVINLLKNAKNLSKKLPVKTTPIDCKIFNNEKSEEGYLHEKIANQDIAIITNNNKLRNNLSLIENIDSDLIFQQRIILLFFSYKNNLDYIYAEILKCDKTQKYINSQELKKLDNIFYQYKLNHESKYHQSFNDDFELLMELFELLSLKLDKKIQTILSKFSKKLNNKIYQENFDISFLLEFYFKDIANQETSNLVNFSFEKRLSKGKNIIISALSNQDWVKQYNFKFINQDITELFGIRQNKDFTYLALADLVSLIYSKKVEMTVTINSQKSMLAILNFLAQENLINFINMNEEIRSIQTKVIFAKPIKARRQHDFSASDIKLLITNPYDIYIKKILKIKNLTKLYETSNRRIFGILIHQILDDLSKTKIKDYEDQKIFIAKQIKFYLSKIKVSNIFHLFINRLHNLFTWWLLTENKLFKDSLNSESEIMVKYEFNNGINIKAVIDRVEKFAENKFQIIDYKTSNLPNKSDIESGYYSQLIIEALLYMKQHNLAKDNIVDPVLIRLDGDNNYEKNEIKYIPNLKDKIEIYDEKIANILSDYLNEENKLYNFSGEKINQSYNNFFHIIR